MNGSWTQELLTDGALLNYPLLNNPLPAPGNACSASSAWKRLFKADNSKQRWEHCTAGFTRSGLDTISLDPLLPNLLPDKCMKVMQNAAHCDQWKSKRLQ